MIAHPSQFTALVEVENLCVRFGQASPFAVRGISFSLNRGECLALVGESGSGKSVTSRTLVGLAGDRAEVHASKLQLQGEDLRDFDEKTWRRIRGGRVGFVLQDALGSFDPLRTIGDEIGEALRLHTRLNAEEREAKVIDLLKSVGVPAPELRASQYPHQLSGGLRQRALIASAIACGPELLIADEPTTALDVAVQAQVLELLETLHTPETGMLIVSHDFAVVSRLADRVAVMRQGLIVEEGPIDAVLQDPQHDYTKSLLAAVSSLHRRGSRQKSSIVAGGIVVAAVGGPSDNTASSYNRKPSCHWNHVLPSRIQSADHPRIINLATKSSPLIEARDLTKAFLGPDKKRRTAVSSVSFTLRRGETLGIVGESGSGKTTLSRLVLGLEIPDHGVVQIEGRAWTSLSSKERSEVRKRIQVVFQDPLGSFDPRYTVERVLGEALDLAGVESGSRRRARARELLSLVRLDESFLTRRPIELSGGQRQRVAIARALAPEPEILVCDEPVSALDISVQAQVLDLLSDLKERLGLSCLFISHDLDVIQRVSDRILVMKDGVVVESGAVDDVFANPKDHYTRTLFNAVPRLELDRRVLSA